MSTTRHTSERPTDRHERNDAYARCEERTRPDASGSWRAEYAHQSVEADLRADGGTATALPTPGDRVGDRESEGGDELLVVDVHPDTRAAEHPIEALEGATVADVNDGYDRDAPVVEAVYLAELEAALDDWRSVEDVRDAVSFGALGAYSLPADRLAPVKGGGSR